MNIEIIARVCHEANKALSEGLDTMRLKGWDDTDEWQKESTFASVKLVLQEDLTAEELHNFWIKDKQDNGWIYGETKDSQQKTHPGMLPFDQLSVVEKAKDKLFLAIVKALKD